MHSRMFGPLLLLATLGVFAFGATATAVPIDGTIDFSVISGGSGDELDTITNTVNASVDVTATGDLIGLDGMTGVVLSFTYDPFSDPLWVIDGFTFVATGGDITDSLNLVTGGEELAITNGTGILSHASYDDTNVLWDFGIGEFGEVFFGLTASAGTDGGAGAGAPMPEPSAAVMFAVGLGIVARSVRKRR